MPPLLHMIGDPYHLTGVIGRYGIGAGAVYFFGDKVEVESKTLSMNCIAAMSLHINNFKDGRFLAKCTMRETSQVRYWNGFTRSYLTCGPNTTIRINRNYQVLVKSKCQKRNQFSGTPLGTSKTLIKFVKNWYASVNRIKSFFFLLWLRLSHQADIYHFYMHPPPMTMLHKEVTN